MPRYFLNLRYGRDKLAIDPEGEELPDLDAARSRALEAARDLIARTRSYSVRDWFTCTFEIVDTAGHSVLTVPFSDTVPDVEDSDTEATST
ncbi:hypothetical protein MKK84_05515 [Methylobacterium sp. E-065]|uniref:DUF6894 family protein n=1 Tax=Methylobacterium sp. E-065 TaxID=2836583 RepID=UPI001FB917FC|nr:hypothetical protein [Methylobacterium sp. E-065]MCJ2016890.1 hypothetical protein [Methylobacterium sp. E-065]